jgi:glycosyltransferase involved in cell wall biosynthesis
MRVGHNPARFVEKVPQPADITVTVVNSIPFLSGYYEQSLDVLKTVVESLNATREAEHPYDIMIFDNHSCSEVRAYLKEASDQGKIQYLVLSDTNIGKIGAWNYMFGAAQGKYVVFSDGDIGFRPGWLSASLEIFNVFPHVGMVTARPLPTPKNYSTATIEWAEKQGPEVLEKGAFLSWNVFNEHGRSLGQGKRKPNASGFAPVNMYRLNFGGKRAFVGAAHFQFTARTDVLKKIIPLKSEQPMRGERRLDTAINDMGLLRLMTEDALVWHMGNRVDQDNQGASIPQRKSFWKKILWMPVVRNSLLWVNNKIFRLYFLNVE